MRILIWTALCFPCLFSGFNGFPFLNAANESLAYRYGHASRLIFQNQDLTLPQGQTVLAVQKIFLEIKTVFRPRDPLAKDLQIFGFGTWGAVCFLFGLGILLTQKTVPLPKFLLAACLPLAMVYGTGNAGAYYYLLPDYYQFNVCFGFLTVLVLATILGKQQPFDPKFALFVGVISGLTLANKITNVLLIWPLLMALSLPMVAFWAIGTFVGFLIPFLVLYNFNLSTIYKVFQNIASFFSSQQGEFGFLSGSFFSQISMYNYGWIAGFCIFIFLIFIIKADSRKRNQGLLWFGPLLFGVLLVLYKRPAGTTMWDMMIPVLMATTVLPMVSKNLKTEYASTMSCIVLIAALFAHNSPFADLHSWAKSLQTSKEIEQVKWLDFEERIKSGKGLPIVVFIENNDFCFGGVDEFLLKAACRFPMWEIDDSGIQWIHKYFPKYFLMHGNGAEPAWPKGLKRFFFYWYERPDLPWLSRRQPYLYQKILDSGSEIQKKQYVSGGKLHMEIYSAIVNL